MREGTEITTFESKFSFWAPPLPFPIGFINGGLTLGLGHEVSWCGPGGSIGDSYPGPHPKRFIVS